MINFIISTITIGDNINNIISNISWAGSTGILNTSLKPGTAKITIINNAETPSANNNILFLNGCDLNTDFLGVLTLNTWTSSANASVTNAIVWPISTLISALLRPSTCGSMLSGVANPIMNAASVIKPIMTPWYATLQSLDLTNMPFSLFGFFFIISSSAGSTASANAGSESVTKLIHNICIGNKGSIKLMSIPNVLLKNGVISIHTNNKTISPMLLEIRNSIAFKIFAYILLPSSTAETIVAKLSSVRITSAASFATSVPTIPIAHPISACFSAGASFTPSPVIATISPAFCHALTILTLCSGATLAYTLYFLMFLSNSSSDIFASSAPVIASSSFSNIPNCCAIAVAVILWSPVIITVFIPAFLHFWTACFASSLGGSIIPHIPTNVKSLSKSKTSSPTCSWSIYL